MVAPTGAPGFCGSCGSVSLPIWLVWRGAAPTCRYCCYTGDAFWTVALLIPPTHRRARSAHGRGAGVAIVRTMRHRCFFQAVRGPHSER